MSDIYAIPEFEATYIVPSLVSTKSLIHKKEKSLGVSTDVNVSFSKHITPASLVPIQILPFESSNSERIDEELTKPSTL